MALETLKGIREIGGFSVVDMGELKELNPSMFNESGSMNYKIFEETIRPFNFIYVRHDVNSISFTIQNGPIKEKGQNGCQIDTMIETSKIILEKLNEKYPCCENQMAIKHLTQCLMWLAARTSNRESRGVEGKNEN